MDSDESVKNLSSSSHSGGASAKATEHPWYKHYALGTLALVYASSFMDRQITAILIEDLKLEFQLSDMQLGLLSGLAFALFYATLGIPIARLADRHNRVNIITVAITIWSAMTALSAAAGSFLHLLAARVGVGVGEAGASPPSHSIISDYYKPRERPLALSIWALGTVLGSLAGVVLGGYIAENYGWRMAFLAAGLPGLLLAVLVKLTVREPPRGQSESAGAAVMAEEVSFRQSAAALWHNRYYRWATGAHVISVFFGYSMAAWLPALFLRQFDLSQSEVGALVGVTVFVAGVPGLLLGGYLASVLARRDAAWEAWVPGLGMALATPALVLALLSDAPTAAAVLFGAAFFFYQWGHGPGLAVVQSSVSPNQRAFAAAVMYFLSNMLALGLGPLFVGYISDLQLGSTPGESLAIGLSVGVVALFLSALAYFYLGRLWSAR